MKLFLDTSSLVKLYHYEDGTDALTTLIEKEVRELWLSELAILEFRSAFWKKVRTGEIGRNDAIQVMQYFKDDEPQFKWVPLDMRILQNASIIIMKYGPQGLRYSDPQKLDHRLRLILLFALGHCLCPL